jgi:hypothetical protein
MHVEQHSSDAKNIEEPRISENEGSGVSLHRMRSCLSSIYAEIDNKSNTRMNRNLLGSI